MKRFDTLKWVISFLAFASFLITSAIGFFFLDREILTPLKLFQSPLRAGDRVYLLTGQWRTKINFHFNRLTPTDVIRTTDMHLDLWCFDAKTVTPAWRKRLVVQRNGAMYNYRLLGAQGDLIWISTPSGPIAASRTNGEIRANAASIQERNPELKGLVPKEEHFFQFDSHGLLMTAADARTWRFDPATLRAFEGKATAGQPATGVIYPTYFTPNSTGSFLSRNLNLPGRWLGLLTESEVESFRKTNTIGGIDLASRRRLYGANGVEASNFFGKYYKYQDFKPLSKEFLGPGLLSYHRATGPYDTVWLRDPDSVLVLHRDRLGEEGKLRLARVAGPESRVVWDAALPLSVLQSALPAQDSVVLYGVEFTPRKDDQLRDPMHEALERLIGIDLVSGRMSVHDQSDVKHHIAATPINVP